MNRNYDYPFDIPNYLFYLQVYLLDVDILFIARFSFILRLNTHYVMLLLTLCAKVFSQTPHLLIVTRQPFHWLVFPNFCALVYLIITLNVPFAINFNFIIIIIIIFSFLLYAKLNFLNLYFLHSLMFLLLTLYYHLMKKVLNVI